MSGQVQVAVLVTLDSVCRPDLYCAHHLPAYICQLLAGSSLVQTEHAPLESVDIDQHRAPGLTKLLLQRSVSISEQLVS